MSVLYLYHTEDPDGAAQCGTGNGSMISLLDHFVARFGGRLAGIHPGGYKAHTDTYESIQAARDAHPDHRLIILDPNGETTLDKLEHPDENVIYLVGPDHGENVLIDFPLACAGGETVRIDVAGDCELFAVASLITVICDREAKGWR